MRSVAATALIQQGGVFLPMTRIRINCAQAGPPAYLDGVVLEHIGNTVIALLDRPYGGEHVMIVSRAAVTPSSIKLGELEHTKALTALGAYDRVLIQKRGGTIQREHQRLLLTIAQGYIGKDVVFQDGVTRPYEQGNYSHLAEYLPRLSRNSAIRPGEPVTQTSPVELVEILKSWVPQIILDDFLKQVKSVPDTWINPELIASQKGTLKKQAVTMQRGDAYVRRYLELHEITEDPKVQEIARNPSLDSDQKAHQIGEEMKRLISEKAGDQDVDIREVSWGEVEVDVHDLYDVVDMLVDSEAVEREYQQRVAKCLASIQSIIADDRTVTPDQAYQISYDNALEFCGGWTKEYIQQQVNLMQSQLRGFTNKTPPKTVKSVQGLLAGYKEGLARKTRTVSPQQPRQPSDTRPRGPEVGDLRWVTKAKQLLGDNERDVYILDLLLQGYKPSEIVNNNLLEKKGYPLLGIHGLRRVLYLRIVPAIRRAGGKVAGSEGMVKTAMQAFPPGLTLKEISNLHALSDLLTRKAEEWSEAVSLEDLIQEDVKPEHQDTVRTAVQSGLSKLKVVRVSSSPMDDLASVPYQHFVADVNGQRYFVDTEGYDYCRYIGLIPNEWSQVSAPLPRRLPPTRESVDLSLTAAIEQSPQFEVPTAVVDPRSQIEPRLLTEEMAQKERAAKDILRGELPDASQEQVDELLSKIEDQVDWSKPLAEIGKQILPLMEPYREASTDLSLVAAQEVPTAPMPTTPAGNNKRWVWNPASGTWEAIDEEQPGTTI